MLAIFTKLLGSKIFSCILLVFVVVAIPIIIWLLIQRECLYSDIEDLTQKVESNENTINDLNDYIKLKEVELQYLKNGMEIVKDYEVKKEKVLENEEISKSQILQTVLSDKEAEDWWNTPIPDNIREYLTCK